MARRVVRGEAAALLPQRRDGAEPVDAAAERGVSKACERNPAGYFCYGAGLHEVLLLLVI